MQRKATALPVHPLRRLQDHIIAVAPEPDQPATDLIIISIPWLKKAEDFSVCGTEVHRQLGNVNIYRYEPWTTVEDSFTWHKLSILGNELARTSVSHREATQHNDPRPLVLMAHSLAGFILKQCVVVADAQKDRYKVLREALTGLVLMGCPHATDESRRTELYGKCNDILRLSSLGRRTKDRLQECHELLNICRKFDDVCGGTNILSVHEQRPTRIPVRLGVSTRYLVEKRLAKIDSGKPEYLTSIDSDHRNLPGLRDAQASLQIDKIAFRQLKKILSVGGKNHATVSDASTAMVISQRSVALGPLIQDFVKPRLPTLPFFKFNMSRQRTKDFHGREDILEKLEAQLLAGWNFAILHGKGGLGKSAVALEFVHRRRHDFDAIFWLQADDLSKMRQDFGRFAAQLGLEDEDEATDPFTSREMMKSWLQQPVRNPNPSGRATATWLVVFDGADDPTVLDEFKSIYGKGSIRVTTREPKSIQTLSVDIPAAGPRSTPLSIIHMHTLNEADAVDMLARLTRISMDDEEEHKSAKKIARMADGWPLVITQMAGIIKSQQLALTEFCERYENISARGLLRNSNTGQEERPSAVPTMLMVLLSPQANALLRVVALLDPDCIHENLFGDIEDVDIPLAGFPTTQDEFEKAKKELLQASLVQRNGARQELWLHRYVQKDVRSQCSSVDLDRAFRTAANLVKRAWVPPGEAVRDNLKLWEPCAAYLKHVLHLQHVYGLYNEAKGRLIKPSFAFAWLLSEVCVLQRNLGNTAGLKNTLDLALSICDDPPGLPRDTTFNLRSDIYHSLGAWANETNHP